MARGKKGAATNGHTPPPTNGHKPAGKLYEFTLPDSGITLRYKRVSPMLLANLLRDFPEPAPPLVEVDYGDGEKKWEPNPADPAYQRAVTEHEIDLNLIGIATAIEEGIVAVVPHAEVQAYRDRYRDRTRTASCPEGKELRGSDLLVYVQYICAGSEDDLNALLEAMGQRSHPTESGVGEAAATFPGQVSRP